MLAPQKQVSSIENKVIQLQSVQKKINVQHMDCMTAVMLKILDKKCQMDIETQQLFIDIYNVIEKNESKIFDLEIHNFISRVFKQPDPLSLMQVHKLRLFAESAIEKSVMKQFKQSYSFVMN